MRILMTWTSWSPMKFNIETSAVLAVYHICGWLQQQQKIVAHSNIIIIAEDTS